MMPAVALLLVAALIYLLRACFVTLVPASWLPSRLRLALDDVGPAIMAALLATHLAHSRGVAAIEPAEIVAVLATAAIAWRTRNLAASCIAGIATVTVLRLL